MRTHIKVVAIVNIVMGGVALVRSVAFLIGGTLGALFSGSLIGTLVGTVASATFGILFGALALFRLMAGVGLLNGKSWARYTVIVCSVLGLFTGGWFGILFGIYSLWALLSAEGRREFSTVSV